MASPGGNPQGNPGGILGIASPHFSPPGENFQAPFLADGEPESPGENTPRGPEPTRAGGETLLLGKLINLPGRSSEFSEDRDEPPFSFRETPSDIFPSRSYAPPTGVPKGPLTLPPPNAVGETRSPTGGARAEPRGGLSTGGGEVHQMVCMGRARESRR